MKKYLQRFTVTGTMSFPLDMIRYDRCWPSTQKDVSIMIDSNRLEKRSIQMTRYVEGPNIRPTEERWMSFGWIVNDIKTEKYS